MLALASTNITPSVRNSVDMSLVEFAIHHLSILSAKSLLQKVSNGEPLKVNLTDGTGWYLDRLIGVQWHLSYPGRGTRIVTSDEVINFSSKWVYK
jgi:hypothetical protein